MENWDGTERRIRCDAHEELITTGIRNNLAIQDIKSELEKIHAAIKESTRAVDGLEKIVTNGLSHRVNEMHENMEKLCGKISKTIEIHNERLEELESFSWFREKVTKWRDESWWTGIKFFFYCLLLMVVLKFADATIVGALLKGLGIG